jgi:hypothetical protein
MALKRLFNNNKVLYDTIVPALTPDMQLIPCGKAAPEPFTNAFNGSIVQGKYVVRLTERKLAIMDWQDGNLSEPKLLEFETENGYAEDPRCFEFNGRPACVFTDEKNMYFAYIDTTELWLMKPPVAVPKDNDGGEKIWSPFVHEERLHVLYAPGHVVEYNLGNPIVDYKTETPTLPGGCIRGGTQLVEYDDKLYTIFHVRQNVKRISLYWAGLMELESKPPFKALRWSRTPLWKATFIKRNDIPQDSHHKQNKPIQEFVTFPSHLEIDSEGNCLILAGYHDYTDAVIQLPLKELLQYIE